MNWKKQNEKLVYDGYRKILKKTFLLPDGRIDDFDVNKEGQVVSILPITIDKKIILFKQFRPGPEKYLLEIPGGGIEEDETPEIAAARELIEETGYAGKLKFIGQSIHSAYSTLQRYNFTAVDCKRVQKTDYDENEFGETIELSLNDFRKHLQSGQLTDVATGYLGLDFLDLL